MPQVEQSEPAETLRTRVADMLDEMAGATQDGRFRTAAALLRGRRPGRRQSDDRAALAYANAMLATGAAASVYRACEMASVVYASSHQAATMRDRLRRKFRTISVKSEDSSL